MAKSAATRLAAGWMRRRLKRLRDLLLGHEAPIVWLRAGPGSGKTRLLGALRGGRQGTPFARWIVLDNPTSKAAITAIESLRPSGRRVSRRLVIASRPDDEVGQAMLARRVYGSVTIIGDSELFLAHSDCRSDAARELLAATGGWPILVDAWMSGRSADLQELLPAFLEREVLPQLPPKLAAALYGALDAPLPTAVLAELSARGACDHPFLQTQGDAVTIRGEWLRDALATLRSRPASLAPAVLDELSGLFMRHADPVRTIVSLLNCGRADDAERIFKRCGGMFFGYRHGYQALEQILSAADPEFEQRSEELFFARLWFMIKSGQPREALLRLDARYPGLPVDLRRMRLSHRPYAVLLRLDISLDIDETPPLEVISSWGRLQALLPPDDELVRGLLFNTMAIGFLQANALVEARQLAEESLTAYERADSPYLAHFMRLHLCDIALRQSRLADASRLLRQADEELQQSGLAFNSETAIVASFQSRIAFEQGRLADCPANPAPILGALVRGDSWPDLIVTMTEHFVLTAFWREGLRKALERLDQFALALSQRHGSVPRRELQLTRIRVLQVARRHPEAGMLLEEYEVEHGTRGASRRDIAEQLIRLRHWMSLEKMAAKASRLATSLSMRPELEIRQRISLSILQAYLRHREKEPAVARRHLRRALRDSEARGLRGVLAEDGEYLERLLPPFLAEPGPGNAPLAAFARLVLRLLHDLPAAPTHSKAIAGVTRQEHRVLAYVIDGYTNKQTARALGLSASTVKFHLRGLFKKFGVSTRAALGETALRRGIAT